MADLEQLKQEMRQKNAFTNYNHMEIDSVEDDRVVFRLEVRPESKNPYNMVHGGALYTLADDAAGVAAHTDGRRYVTQNGSLNFVRNTPEGTVYAAGKVRHRGRVTCLVDVDITDATGRLLATGEFSYFCLDYAAAKKE